ncbi:LysR family transcriptional regulator [Sansalvadorimonas sp. 2012CJ34-2]|uniref:LysR family transcriptional regulator n=1 Tax=Parendozoicomonas callyspongiae TaxID=2942213 RepID=A0ABT0PDK0_9GAMM|nr:LysR family transcriptional regulator [Sansalvadorimonas sp. 2012CJ34-2]MCL6269463.1 LysR family transcriptional regulator [Sansalvadorimonas sp. 2012CJ34-2]
MKIANRDSNAARLQASDDSVSLNRLNLNLLPSLKALLDTRNVSEAAKLLCVTQPTMSRNLAQLRENLCDPILVRRGNHTQLSEMARTIHPQVNRLVVEASTIFENANFDPQTTSRHFCIAGNYSAVEQVFPKLLCDLHKEVPNFTFEVELLCESAIERLHGGEIDLAVGYSGMPPAGLRSHEVLHYHLSCLMSREHPLANRSFMVEELTEYPHLIHTSGCSLAPNIQAYYRRLGIKPALSSPSFSAAQEILANSDFLCFHTCVRGGYDHRLVARQVPDVAPEVDCRLVWPEYWNANRSHRWLRDRVFREINQLLAAMDNVVPASANSWVAQEFYD